MRKLRFDDSRSALILAHLSSEPKTKMRVYTVKGVSLWKEVFKTTFNTSNGRLGRLLQSHGKNPEALHKDQ